MGLGFEFSDYRRYSSGDDPRSLDWNAYLRLGKLLLKTYRMEERVSIRILLDCSESMNTGHGQESKFTYARHLAAAFAYLTLLHLDTVAIAPFGARMAKPLVVSGGRDAFWPVVDFLNSLNCGGETNLFDSTKQFLAAFPQKGTVLAISDFFDEEGCERAVDMLRTTGHDLVLIQVHTAEELRPTSFGELMLEDAGNRRKANRGRFGREHGGLRTKFPGVLSTPAAAFDPQRRPIHPSFDDGSLRGVCVARVAAEPSAGMNWLTLTLGEVAGFSVVAGALALWLYLRQPRSLHLRVSTLRFWESAPSGSSDRRRLRLREPWPLLAKAISFDSPDRRIRNPRRGAAVPERRSVAMVIDSSAWSQMQPKGRALHGWNRSAQQRIPSWRDCPREIAWRFCAPMPMAPRFCLLRRTA